LQDVNGREIIRIISGQTSQIPDLLISLIIPRYLPMNC
jgi:hypothetical protein